jgi:hypothetical protein
MLGGLTAGGASSRLALRGQPGDLQPIERLTWQRTDAPFLVPPGGGTGLWDGASIYTPVLARNLDRTPYQDEDGNFYLYYNGDNTSPGDLDQVGLALSPDFETWVPLVDNPVIPLGADPSADAGDAQICSVFHDGTEFILFFQGNASAPGSGLGDNVTLLWATSLDGKTITKEGSALTQGAGGDAEDLYWCKLIPNAPGGPRLYYAGKNAESVFGIMCAVSLGGDVRGPWTRLSDNHLLRDGTTVLGDAWYADGLYHFIYSPLDGVKGAQYATSADGVNINWRRQILDLNPGEWDERPYHVSWVQRGGSNYLLFNSHAYEGIGFVVG